MDIRRTIIAATAALGLAAVGLAAVDTPAQADPVAWPDHYSAPYADISLYPPFDLVATAKATGNRFFTLAFILNGGGSCTAAWSNSATLDSNFMVSDINNLRAMGGDVAISIGGANGTEPAASCATPADLQAQYQRVVSTYNLTHLDFDVEGGALSDSATIDRRNKAIKGLEAANPALSVSYTLPVLPSALTQPGIDLLTNAASNGTRVDRVNMMTMDYGSPNSDMGGAAISAANALHTQLAGIFSGKSDAQLWSMEGITPMIGQNDSQGEVFSLSDAQNVISFANQHGIGELAFWAVGRDNGGCANAGYASPSCSGLAQNQWDFTKAFAAYTPGSLTTPPPATGCGQYSTWSSAVAYQGGAVVSYNGHEWTAKWWTQGDVPGNNAQGVWTDDGAC